MLAIIGGVTLWYVSSVTNMASIVYLQKLSYWAKILIQVMPICSCPKIVKRLKLYGSKIINVSFMI